MKKVSIQTQKAAVKAFLDRNCMIDAGEKGRLHREHMRAAYETLDWLERNEKTIKSLLGNKT